MNNILAMHSLELKAKVKPGKENEMSQVIKDLIPLFNSIADLKMQVYFAEEEGELKIAFSNEDGSENIKQLNTNKSFNLLLGSIKVLCVGYTLSLSSDTEKIHNLITINGREEK